MEIDPSKNQGKHAFKNGDIQFLIYLKNIVAAPLQVVYDLFIIYTYIKVKSFRKKPGDLFVMVAVMDMMVTFYMGFVAYNSQWFSWRLGV
jgi:hypothetical protein